MSSSSPDRLCTMHPNMLVSLPRKALAALHLISHIWLLSYKSRYQSHFCIIRPHLSVSSEVLWKCNADRGIRQSNNLAIWVNIGHAVKHSRSAQSCRFERVPQTMSFHCDLGGQLADFGCGFKKMVSLFCETKTKNKAFWIGSLTLIFPCRLDQLRLMALTGNNASIDLEKVGVKEHIHPHVI